MDRTQLNLARKWRSQNFDQVVGQDLAVRILKNTLYRGSYFPVYLFAGQRGCGKTTMARIFASAVNCAQLAAFQKDPRSVQIPCLSCASCKAVTAGCHPDFIEIDAASHTGVDHVRQIIEAASLLPVLGVKKIYLIDEAHMLSKAAFNAFLKIMEEPPASVLFILATTDMHKIIDTVTSRCFQIFFKAVDTDSLQKHLQAICVQEQIAYDVEGIVQIVHATQGSVRDAINLLEQVRFAYTRVDAPSVLSVLGKLDESAVVDLFATVVTKHGADNARLIEQLQLETYRPAMVWQHLIEIFRVALWCKYGCQPQLFIAHVQRIEAVVAVCTVDQLLTAISYIFSIEMAFLRSTNQAVFLQMVLMKLNQIFISIQQPVVEGTIERKVVEKKKSEEPVKAEVNEVDTRWAAFVEGVVAAGDQLICSMVRQLQFLSYDMQTHCVTASLPAQHVFFGEWLEATERIWKPVLQKAFGAGCALKINFDKQDSVQRSLPLASAPSTVVQKTAATVRSSQIDVTDGTWKKAELVVRFFPGTITYVEESSHE